MKLHSVPLGILVALCLVLPLEAQHIFGPPDPPELGISGFSVEGGGSKSSKISLSNGNVPVGPAGGVNAFSLAIRYAPSLAETSLRLEAFDISGAVEQIGVVEAEDLPA